MMTSYNGNIFRVTGPLSGEFAGEFPSQRSVTRSFADFFDLRLNKRLGKQLWGWWFDTPSYSSWRYCNDLPVSKFSVTGSVEMALMTIAAANTIKVRTTHTTWQGLDPDIVEIWKTRVSIRWTPDIFLWWPLLWNRNKYPYYYIFPVEFGGTGDIHKHQNSGTC